MHSKGLCRGHYTQRYRGRGLRPIRPHVLSGQVFDACTVLDCARAHLARGLCRGHYAQMRRGRAFTPVGPDRRRGERIRAVCAVEQCGLTHRRNGFCAAHSYILRVYDLSPHDYQRALEAQGGTCAICRNPCRRNPRLSVDHDHRTGRFRGLLCDRCNTGLGKFNEDPTLLRAAAAYLSDAARQGSAL